MSERPAIQVERARTHNLKGIDCRVPHGAVTVVTGPSGAGTAGDPFTLGVRLPRPKKGANDALGELIRQGFQRRLKDGEVVRMEPGEAWPSRLDPLPLVLGRFPARAESSARILDTLEQGWRMNGGKVEARGGGALRLFSRELSCPVCGETSRRPPPPLFSFNSPLGACPECQGFGRVIGIDRERVIPDPRRSLSERPIAPWNTPAYEELYDDLLAAAKKKKIPLDVPWMDLTPEAREWVWSGKGSFDNLTDFFHWLEGRTYKVHVRVLLARYRS